MKQLPYPPRRARWAVPAAIVALAGGVLAGSVPSAAAAPRLPARSATQLLAALRTQAQAPPLSGTVSETVSLGLPALPSGILGAATAPAALLSGSHSVQVWYSGPEHYRIAVPQSLSEYDLIRNGNRAWLWDSSANSVTHISLPAGGPAPAVPSVPLTPQQAASQAVASVGPATVVRVDSNVTVAGQAAYQLVLAPKSQGSLIGQVRIAIDSRNHMPLRVEVFAKGAASPAVQTGFTAVSFTRPPASDYAFTPPAGAKVSNEQAGPASQAGAGQATPAGRPSAGSAGRLNHAAAASGIRVIGSGWLSVADLPSSALGWLTGSALTGQPGGSGPLPFEHSSSQQAPGSAGQAPGSAGRMPPVGRAPAAAFGPLAGALLAAARPVHGSWGSGQLLRTSLVSVLITSNGRILVGAVTPAVLYRAATQPGHPLTGMGQHSISRHGASRAGTK
jgi:outer membrane lipoprotein-sorting protein